MSAVDQNCYEVTLYWMADKELQQLTRTQLAANVVEAIARASKKITNARPGIDVFRVQAELMNDLTAQQALQAFRNSKAAAR